ncbi:MULTISPECIES: GrpB family protein [Kordiimonas]|jgi:GrpB-like predicted nucleotidyltransferase (UPF0157 family)|uniref:GrpB family protein n=1 Tax=Kordiimonas TaxID=288021 RepID=UPI00257C1323|nr:GrpB family protein [Kordiimonas sp. UBA4487]
MTKSVHLVPHRTSWKAAFDEQVPVIRHALGNNAVCIAHIGSTAIPGILAKPIIDILVEVADVDAVDEATPAMLEAGFEAKGEYGIPGRRYFRLTDGEGRRTHHVHVFEKGSHHAVRHVAFRDFMRAHPEMAQAYSDLKANLAEMPGPAYQDAKSAFVEEIQAIALKWVEVLES